MIQGRLSTSYQTLGSTNPPASWSAIANRLSLVRCEISPPGFLIKMTSIRSKCHCSHPTPTRWHKTWYSIITNQMVGRCSSQQCQRTSQAITMLRNSRSNPSTVAVLGQMEAIHHLSTLKVTINPCRMRPTRSTSRQQLISSPLQRV